MRYLSNSGGLFRSVGLCAIIKYWGGGLGKSRSPVRTRRPLGLSKGWVSHSAALHEACVDPWQWQARVALITAVHNGANAVSPEPISLFCTAFNKARIDADRHDLSAKIPVRCRSQCERDQASGDGARNTDQHPFPDHDLSPLAATVIVYRIIKVLLRSERAKEIHRGKTKLDRRGC